MSRFSLNFANYESLGFSDITQSLYFRTHRTINQRSEYYSTLNPTKINEHSTLRYSPDRAKMVTVIGSSTKSSTKYFRRNERERGSIFPYPSISKREKGAADISAASSRLTWFFSPTYSLLLSKGLWKPSSSSKQLPLRKTRFSRAFPFGIGKNRGPPPETGNNTRAGSRVNFHLVPRSGRFTFLCAK